jgi:hypothetical protein
MARPLLLSSLLPCTLHMHCALWVAACMAAQAGLSARVLTLSPSVVACACRCELKRRLLGVPKIKLDVHQCALDCGDGKWVMLKEGYNNV